MTNNKKGKLQAVAPQPTPAAQVIITAFTDQPPSIQSTATMSDTLRLMAVALSTLANVIDQENLKKAQADFEDKKREFLGPREG